MYKRRATGEGPNFREMKRTRVSRKDCGYTISASSLRHHTERAHVRVLPQVRGVDFGGGGLEVYKVSFYRILKSVDCPVEGCPAKAKTPGRLREHFMFRHWKSKVAIFQEGPEPLPRYYQCKIHMQAARLFKHRQLEKCHKSMERQVRQRDVEMAERCGGMEFKLDGEEGDKRVDNVPTFQYLGLPLDQTDDDWTDVRQNIMRARLVWERLGTLL